MPSSALRFRGLTGSTSDVIPVGILIASLLITALAYSPGLGGTLHFDDPHNLGGLSNVTDFRSAIEFALQRTAGPLGRPIALASFAPQAYAWPNTPEVFLYTNILLHLLNGLLIVWAAFLVTAARGISNERAALTATAAGAVWLLLPILASSSLLIVQRMTTLSATFVLLGLIFYLYSRRLLDTRPRHALLLMSISVGVGTALAAFTKENGALLPALLLITEATLLASSKGTGSNGPPRWWRVLFLTVPTLAILTYLALRIDYSEATRVTRNFSAMDRILTEAHILWQYLYNAFLPATSNLGPFHDAHPVHRSWLSPISAAALLGWGTAIVGAILFRQKAPVFSFAVGWYLVGHSIESSTVPLELYFEHRNYIPLFGPVLGLASAVMAAGRLKGFVRTTFAVYLLILTSVLFNLTTIWGQPALAGEMWAIYNPESKRAAQYLAQQLERTGDYSTSRKVLVDYYARHPESVGVQLQALALSCIIQPDAPQAELLSSIKTNLTRPNFEHGVFEALQRLREIARDGSCHSVQPTTVYSLASVAASNPAYKAVRAATHNLHILMAEHAFEERDLNLTMQHIEQALEARFTMTTLALGLQMLISAELYSDAAEFASRAQEHKPLNPVQAALWRQQLARLQEAIPKQRL